jgi:hypothetical protein
MHNTNTYHKSQDIPEVGVPQPIFLEVLIWKLAGKQKKKGLEDHQDSGLALAGFQDSNSANQLN